MKQYILLLFSYFFFISCSSSIVIEEVPIDYDALNEIEIQDYITENNLSPQKSDTGLYYIIKEEGTGNKPTLSSNITVYYKGYDTKGVVFDESPIEGLSFNLSEVIKGFSEGMTYLRENGEATLIIPSKIAYNGNSSFYPFSGKVILFDVKLISIN
jgi:FKBP-type peptidyl-prolyl cis-trans isomerase FkpA